MEEKEEDFEDEPEEIDAGKDSEDSEEKDSSTSPNLEEEKPFRTIEWEASEFVFRTKTRLWYITVGAITLLAAFDVYLTGNLVFTLLIILCGASLAFFGSKPPLVISFQIERRGIFIDDTLHRFQEYQSFWIAEKKRGNLLLLTPNKLLAQETIIPLGNTDLYEVQDILLKHLPEEEISEPFSHWLMTYLGF